MSIELQTRPVSIHSADSSLATSARPAPGTESPCSEEVEAKEWKYTGYRGFSEFISSDDDFFILRRFGALNARVLLALQDEISQLEQELISLDIKFSRKNAPDIHNGSFRAEVGSERWILLRKEIYAKLRDYNEFVLQHSQLRKRPPVADKDINSVKQWIHNHTNAIQEQESQYLEHSSDLFSVVPKTKTPLRRLFERSPQFRLLKPWRVKPMDLECHDPKHEFYTSDERIDAFVSATIISAGIAMLITPLWILNFVNSRIHSLGVITAFIILFVCLFSYATVAKPMETLGGTAAYSAVLMVFLQINF